MLTYIGDRTMEQGTCPKCGSGMLNYETIVDITPSDQAIYYPYECECGFVGKEYYNLVFTEHTDENDVAVEGDTHG
jgi:C4-type Zn-finger protein